MLYQSISSDMPTVVTSELDLKLKIEREVQIEYQYFNFILGWHEGSS